jgi:hypothetical protein
MSGLFVSLSEKPMELEHEPFENALLDACNEILPSGLVFLSQSASVLSAVAEQQDSLSEKIVNFIFPDELPAALYLTVIHDESTGASSISWEETSIPSSSASPPSFVLVAKNSSADGRSAQLIHSSIRMQNLPLLPVIATTVHNLISFLATPPHHPQLVCSMAAVTLPSTRAFLERVLHPRGDLPYTKTAAAQNKASRLELNCMWERQKMTELYPEIVHIIDSFANLQVDFFSAAGEPALNFHMNNHSVDAAINVSGDELALLNDGAEPIHWEMASSTVLIRIDSSLYLSRWGLVSIKAPRINIRIEQKKVTDAGDLTFDVKIDSMENAGGTLSYVLPLKRLSKYLSDVFLVTVTLTAKGDFKFDLKHQFPVLPKWILSLAKLFIGKTAGGGIKILRDFVVAIKDDILRVNEGRSNGSRETK